MKTITLNVTGMSCEGCASSVKTALSQLAGVHTADVSLADMKAVLEVDDALQAADLVRAVELAGYQAVVSE